MAKPGNTARKVLLDTNCFIRLYTSPLLPLMQQVVAGYQLLTLKELGEEYFNGRRLNRDFPWVGCDPRASDLKAGYLKVRGTSSARVDAEKPGLRRYSDAFLSAYCAKRGINPVKSLSRPDLTLLASAVVFRTVIATDEWPLRMVVQDLTADPDDDYGIELMSSLEVLALFERQGLLTQEARVQTVDSWQRLRESLPKGWQADYERLFSEMAPVLD